MFMAHVCNMLSSLENFTGGGRAFNPLKQKKSMSMLRKIENYLLEENRDDGLLN